MTFLAQMRLLSLAAASLIAFGCRSSGASSASAMPAGAPTPIATPALPTGVTTAMVAQGDSIFNNRSCKNCHLAGGVGGPRAPSLTDAQWIHIDGSYDAIVKLVTTGFTKAEQIDKQYQFSMNPRGGINLTDGQIRSVAAYVWSLSHR
jgi:cytochrome c5